MDGDVYEGKVSPVLNADRNHWFYIYEHRHFGWLNHYRKINEETKQNSVQNILKTYVEAQRMNGIDIERENDKFSIWMCVFVCVCVYTQHKDNIHR